MFACQRTVLSVSTSNYSTASKQEFKNFIKSFLLPKLSIPRSVNNLAFCMQGNHREAVFKTEDGYRLRGSRVSLDEHDLVAKRESA